MQAAGRNLKRFESLNFAQADPGLGIAFLLLLQICGQDLADFFLVDPDTGGLIAKPVRCEGEKEKKQ
jgi:hypothetical protein